MDRWSGLPAVVPNDLTAARIATLVVADAPVLLEIGCNDGRDTEQFLAAMPGARIHCFEPDARAAARFTARLGHDQRVSLHRFALGADTGEATFHVSSGSKPGYEHDWDLSGSIRRPKNHLAEHEWISFSETTTVPVLRLDDWCETAGVDRIDFIWMDVQGAERDVIEGGQRALSRTRYLYTEYSNDEMYEGQPNLRDLLVLLSGFEIVARYPHDVLLRNRTL